MTDTAKANDREIVIRREFDAPRELLFDAWTDPDQIGKWWGPNGFSTTTHEMDVRPGGRWRFMMHGPDGTDYPNEIVYTEVEKPERLAYDHGSGEEDDPDQFHVTVTFEEQDSRTTLTMRMRFATAEQRDKTVEFGAVEGANQTLDRLEEHLARAARAGVEQ